MTIKQILISLQLDF